MVSAAVRLRRVLRPLWGAIALLAAALALEVAQAQDIPALPWAKREQSQPSSPKRAQSARELLVNIEASQLAMFRDGVPANVDEDEPLFRILYRLPLFGANDTERLARPFDSETLATLLKEPAKFRADLFTWRGRVTRIERREVLPELASRLEFDHFWRVDVELAVEGSAESISATLNARTIPTAWRELEEVDEAFQADALFLKVASEPSQAPHLQAACDRIEWRPNRPNERWKITPDHVRLAQLGFDVSRLTDLIGRDNKALGGAEAECFYSMLRAVSRATADQTKDAASFQLGPLLQRPAEHHGQLTRVAGRLKRVSRVAIDDADLAQRLGFDHYYQLDLIVPLGKEQVRLAASPQDKSGPLLANGFPVVCNVVELPPALRGLAERADVNEDIVCDAFYYRLWSFQSGFLDRYSAEQLDDASDAELEAGPVRRRQPSPLFLARTARLVTRPPAGSSAFSYVVGGLILATVVGLFGLQWYTGRSDRRTRERLRAALPASPPASVTPVDTASLPDRVAPDSASRREANE